MEAVLPMDSLIQYSKVKHPEANGNTLEINLL